MASAIRISPVVAARPAETVLLDRCLDAVTHRPPGLHASIVASFAPKPYAQMGSRRTVRRRQEEKGQACGRGPVLQMAANERLPPAPGN